MVLKCKEQSQQQKVETHVEGAISVQDAQQKECGVCKYCKDKPKYGVPGSLKQCCVKRKCTMISTWNNSKHGAIMTNGFTCYYLFYI